MDSCYKRLLKRAPFPESWPTSGQWHPAGLNLGTLFDSAQGGAVHRETMLTLAAKRRSTRGARDDAVPEKDLASVEVILLCMQPLSVFSEWWALGERRRHVGAFPTIPSLIRLQWTNSSFGT